MTDQIYYKIQYPIKKAITTLKNIDEENPDIAEYDRKDLIKIQQFLQKWENEGEKSLLELIKKLRQK